MMQTISMPSTSSLGVKESAKCKFESAVNAVVQNTFMIGKTPVVLSSYGKDSTLVKMIATAALRKFMTANPDASPELLVFTSLVGGFESPVMSKMVTEQVKNLKEFAVRNNLPIKAHVIKPNLSENFLLQMISGRAFASFPGQDKTCSVSLKESPMERLKKKIGGSGYVSLFGTRFDESKERGASMAKRGESATKLRKDKTGRLSLSPIADFSEEEVFSIISDSLYFELGLSEYECPVNAELLLKQYQLGSETECSMKAFMSASETGQGSCGASGRFGCWGCLKVSKDNKHEQIAKEDGYEWLQSFINIREAMKATQYKWNKRTWLTRRVSNGKLKIEPCSYSPEFCKDLLRWCLTAQAETGHEIINLQELLWISLNWGRYGIANPAEAIWIYLQIESGERFHPSSEDMTPAPKTPTPKGQWVDVTDQEFGQITQGNFNIGAAAVGIEKARHSSINIPSSEELEDFFAIGAYEFAIKALKRSPVDVYHSLVMMTGCELPNADTERMLQRSNLIWRKGLMDKLSNPRALVNALISVEQFELIAS